MLDPAKERVPDCCLESLPLGLVTFEPPKDSPKDPPTDPPPWVGLGALEVALEVLAEGAGVLEGEALNSCLLW